ncbi:MAG TPA: CRTAC1 family protein [Longimicrobiales bacterium]
MRTLPFLLLPLGLWLAPLPPFEPVQPELFSAGGALANAWADIDGDGDLDLFVGFNGTPNRLYLNDRGTFADGAAAAGVADARPTRAAAWGDYDGDGDPDLLAGFTAGAGGVLRLYRNDRARFTDVTAAAGIAVDSGAVRQPVWIDVDGDGDLDLFVAFRDRANALFRNDDGHFTDVAVELGLADTRRTVGAVWLDYDEDGDPDLVVGNMDGDANGVFRNEGVRFTDVASELGLEWGGRAPGDASNGTVRPCTADVDADGRLDLFFANYGPNGLFLNRGAGRFEDVSAAWGIAIDGRYDTCAFADIDHDGRIDLYVNGTITRGTSHPDFLFRNTGSGFADETSPLIRDIPASHGAQWADADGDGDPDLALAGTAPGATHPLLRNLLERSTAARSIVIHVLDAHGRAVPGAEVRAYRAGTRALLGTRLVDAGSGYNGQNVQPVHVGVADVASVDIEVIVPARGTRSLTRVDAVAVGADGPAVVTVRAIVP